MFFSSCSPPPPPSSSTRGITLVCVLCSLTCTSINTSQSVPRVCVRCFAKTLARTFLIDFK